MATPLLPPMGLPKIAAGHGDYSRQIGSMISQAQPTTPAAMPTIKKPNAPQNGSASVAAARDSLSTVRTGCMTQGYPRHD